jgi:uncharacterized surface protein with fasciclin (FAS1) repeats
MNHASVIPPFAATSPNPAPASGPRPVLRRRDLLETLSRSGQHRTLIRLAAAASMGEDLADWGPFTLFAPTDAAFARLGGEVEAWLDPARVEELCDRLEYHLVRGAADLGEAVEVGALRSVHGDDLHLRDDEDTVRVDHARVMGAPIPCANGVLVILDGVLAPRALTQTELRPAPPVVRRDLDAPPATTHRCDEARAAFLRLAPNPLRQAPTSPASSGEPAPLPVGAAALRLLPPL